MRDAADALVDAPDPTPAADDMLARQEAVRAALSRFVALPPLQRSCVILKDVLDQTLDEIATELETTVAAVQAALHRGRRALREHVDAEPPPVSPVLVRYAALFGARNWDEIRAMLADDVRLDVIDRGRKLGRRDVDNYFGNNERLRDWSVEPRVIDHQQVLAVSRNGAIAHLVAITIEGERVTAIRDYFHVPYLLAGAQLK
jgi:RNA polymerase sigma-70 factor (ECF subfamily)